MSIVRSTLVSDARQFADAASSTRWDDQFILRLADAVFRREWSGILNVNRLYRTGTRTPAITYNGALGRASLDLSLLDGGAEDTAELLYRIISVQADNRPYSFEQIDRVPGVLTQNATMMQPSFWITGTTLTLSTAGSATIPTILVNHSPQRPSALAGDASTVVFPVGYETILSLGIGAMMLMKGGAETDASRELAGLATVLRDDMLSDVLRFTTDAQGLRHSDSASEWSA